MFTTFRLQKLSKFFNRQAASGYQFLKIAAYNNSNLLLQIEENWKKMLISFYIFSWRGTNL